jgi:hypothetical protein
MSKINGVWFDTVASASDFLSWYTANCQKDFGFTENTVSDFMVDDMFQGSKLSCRYSQTFCKQVIEGDVSEYWKQFQPYYPIILKFMQDFELENVRFNCDW